MHYGRRIKQKETKPSVYTQHMDNYTHNYMAKKDGRQGKTRIVTNIHISSSIALTLALTVWMYSKWPPSYWKLMGFWLKNHWKATSSEVSCVALQLSTTLSPTVTSTRLGLSATRMASGSTKLLHCHLRLTAGGATSERTPPEHSPPSDKDPALF